MKIRFGPHLLILEPDTSLHQVGGKGGQWEKRRFYRKVIDSGEIDWPPLEMCIYPSVESSCKHWMACLGPTTSDSQPSVEARSDTLQGALEQLWVQIRKHDLLRARIGNAGCFV